MRRCTTLKILFVLTMVFGSGPAWSLTDYYVNGATGNDTYDGLSATFTSGTNGPKQTIQAGINAASANDTVNVAGGTYTQDLTISATKTNLQVIGASSSTTTIKGVQMVPDTSFPLAAPNVDILANGVKLHGFTIEGPTPATGFYSSGVVVGGSNVEIYNNAFRIPNASNLDDISQGLQTYRDGISGAGDLSGLNIHDNTFTSIGTGTHGYEGIFINHTPTDPTPAGTVTITNNQFTGNIFRGITSERSKTTISNNSIITDNLRENTFQGINLMDYSNREQRDVTISGNTVKGSATGSGFFTGLRIGAAAGAQTLVNFSITNNIIQLDTIGIHVRSSSGAVTVFNNTVTQSFTSAINNEPAAVLNASSNFWGLDLAPVVSGNVDFTPWFPDGTDTQPGTPGFQGDFSNLTASAANSQIGGTGRIQEAINLVSQGGTVSAKAGTYNENVSLGRELLLIGSGASMTTINGGGVGNCITLTSSFVRVRGFTLTNGTNGIGGESRGAQIRFNTIDSNLVSGISLKNTDYALLHANLIYSHPSGSGIHLVSSKYTTITGNNIHDNQYNVQIATGGYRSSEGNIIQGNTLVDPGTWSVLLSTDARTAKVNFNVFSTAASNKYISNTVVADTVNAQYNWFGGENPPQSTDFNGLVDTSHYYATNTTVSVMPATHAMPSSGSMWLPVMAMVPAGMQVKHTAITLNWNSAVIQNQDAVFPGWFFTNKKTVNQTETFTPTVYQDSVRVDQALVGDTTGAGNPLSGIPYVGTLLVMRFEPVSSDTSSMSLSNIVMTDQHGVDISPVTVGNASQIIVDPGITQGISVDVKVMMQGPYLGTTMSPTLNANSLLPLSQPYTASPFSYSGTESVPSIPTAQVVDWVMLELRTGTAASTKFATRAGFVLSDGTVSDLNGTSPIVFLTIDPGNYYIVVRHRNHLAVMSAAAVALSNPSPAQYNFTTAQAQAFGTSPMKDLGSGVFGMWAGDANSSGGITASDRLLWQSNNGTFGYKGSDFNLTGSVTASDRLLWQTNNGKITQVP